MTNERFGTVWRTARRPEQEITMREMDLARSIQEVTDEIMLKMARYARAVTGKDICAWPAAWRSIAWPTDTFCGAGSSTTSGFSRPPATRAGLGRRSTAGTTSWAIARMRDNRHDSIRGSLLGTEFHARTDRRRSSTRIGSRTAMDLDERNLLVAEAVANEKVVGLFQGRMEFGPRALGQPLDPGRRPQPEDAVVFESRHEVSRKFSAVRPDLPGRGCAGVF